MRSFIIALSFLVSSIALGQSIPLGTKISEVAFVKGTAAPTEAEVFEITALADVSGSLSAKYLKFCLVGGTCYAPWFDIANGSTAPVVAGHTLLEINIATDATAGEVGDALQAGIDGITGVACTDDNSGVVTCTLDDKGVATDVNAGDSGFTVSVTNQGVSSSYAVLSTDVISNVMGYRICNHSANTSTWMAVGKETDTETDGIRLKAGQCFDCPSCTGKLLKETKVSSQAASNDYSVIQFKQ
jgi:hypothetical protein